jgi:acetyl-CoA acyltransferase
VIRDAFICDAQRTPFGRYGGALSSVRTDDLAAVPLRALMQRNASVDWAALDDVLLGCANQAIRVSQSLCQIIQIPIEPLTRTHGS